MKDVINGTRRKLPTWATLSTLAVVVWAMIAVGFVNNGALADTATRVSFSSGETSVTCPSGQCFTDVSASNTFSPTINSLYEDGIISGYACGGPSEPCDSNHRPYYRPNNTVTRAQMSKFVDNGRRNIADATGNSLAISTTTFIALDASTTSAGEAVRGECLTPALACWAVEGYTGVPGNYAGHFTGGMGLYAQSDDSTAPAVDGSATGSTSAGGEFTSNLYRSLQVDAPPAANGFVQLGVTGLAPTNYAARIFNGGMYIEGDLVVGGSKTGYVVDAMQNVDSAPLEPGDVVVITGNSTPVIGQIPVVTVKKATSAYDTGVVGVVDQALYVPDAATKAKYDAEQKAINQAQAQRNQIAIVADRKGVKPDYSSVQMPQSTINDQDGSVHAIEGATSIAAGGYANVVTLGSYKAVKVDASFGPVRAGDLLTTSPHAGYAMKVTDKSQAFGATIGKALGDLESGTGLVPIMVNTK